MKISHWLYVAAALVTTANFAAIGSKQHDAATHTPLAAAPAPKLPNITTQVPGYLDYPGVVTQLKTWNKEAPNTEVKTYGKSRRGTDLYYLRIGTAGQPKVLITACIHGNEPWATGCVMGYAGSLLGKYGKDPEVTKLLDSREIYFVPVVCPDSYPHSRYTDGVDPNRDFPGPSRPMHKSTPQIQAVQDLFKTIKPDAVISGHTHGRVFLQPFGDKMQLPPDDADFKKIVGKMAEQANYRLQRACQMYNRPIHGSEVDWYYRNGAFAVVMEFGTHQQIPSHQQITSEIDRTWAAVLTFLQEAPSRHYGVVPCPNYRSITLEMELRLASNRLLNRPTYAPDLDACRQPF